MCGCRETREKLSVEEYFYKDGMGVDREPEMEAGGKIKQEYVSEDKEKEISENKAVLYIYDGLNGNKTFEIDEDETVTKLRKMFGKEALTESSQGWRGTAKYYIDFGDGYWRLTWVKSYGSIQNPYESVNAVVNRRTRELTTYRRFDEAPNTITPGITQSDAFERLTQLDTVEGLNLSNAECELTFTKRNYLRDENSTTRHYGEVRMAYHFTIGNYSVYIDAATGEDIAYSEKRMVARAFSADGEGAFPNPQKQTADATTCFNELGYTTYEPCISAQYYLRQSLDAFIDDDKRST